METTAPVHRRCSKQIILPELITLADLFSSDSNEFVFSSQNTQADSNFIVIPPNVPEMQQGCFSVCLPTHFIGWKNWNGHKRAVKTAAGGFMTWICDVQFICICYGQLFQSKQTCQQMFKKVCGGVQTRSHSSVLTSVLWMCKLKCGFRFNHVFYDNRDIFFFKPYMLMWIHPNVRSNILRLDGRAGNAAEETRTPSSTPLFDRSPTSLALFPSTQH